MRKSRKDSHSNSSDDELGEKASDKRLNRSKTGIDNNDDSLIPNRRCEDNKSPDILIQNEDAPDPSCLRASQLRRSNNPAIIKDDNQKSFMNPRKTILINHIQPPCQGVKTGSCANCFNKPMPLSEFQNRVTYEAVKLGLESEGISPLRRNSSKFDCEFLNNWIDKNNEKFECKFLVVVAMYNEDCDEFDNTLEGIKNNIRHFTSGNHNINIEQIGVIIIVDGIEPFLKCFLKIDGHALNRNTKVCCRKNRSYFSQFFNLDVIKETFGASDLLKKEKSEEFQLMKDLLDAGLKVRGQEIAHLFSQKVKFDENYSLNTIFCVKQLNKRKLNTHRWFFEGFCVKINPTYVALLDVGTIPDEMGLYLLYDAMEEDKRIAGCCGEIVPDDSGTYNPIVQAQVVEYKFSHIMDKGLESIIGYVSVLPGAFSAYRWESLNDPQTLNSYFYSQRPGVSLDLFTANMYLAEDRILCMELMCQKNKYNILRYVKGSVAKTDVPSNLNQLMAQRRRWVNGSWFSLIYTIKNCRRIGDSNHSCFRKMMFRILMFYYAIVAVFNWVLVGAFYLAFVVSVKMNLGEKDISQDRLTRWSTPLIFLYGCILCSLVVTSFSVKPVKIEFLSRIICIALGCYTYTTMFLTLYFIFSKGFELVEWRNQLAAAMIIVLGIIFSVIILLNWKDSVMPVVKGVVSYVFMTGTYVNIFLIYSICNIHDVSWGNRPDKMTEDEKKLVDEYKNERTRWVLVWILSNAAFAYFSNIVTSQDTAWGKAYIVVLMLVAYLIIIMKFLGGFLYFLDENFCTCLHENNKGRNRMGVMNR